MLDLRFVRTHAELVKRNVYERNLNIDVAKLLELYEQSLNLEKELQALRQERNSNSKQAHLEAQRQHGRKLKQEIIGKEKRLAELKPSLRALQASLPNMSEEEAPYGSSEEANLVMRSVGQPPQFDFKALDHLQLNAKLDLFDFGSAARISGSRFYFLKNQAVLLELALQRFALHKLAQHGFQLYTTPDLVRTEIASGIGFQPRGEESNIYCIEDEDLCLTGTAEIPLGGLYAGQILELEKPLLLAGLSHCFRREAGAAGQYSKGLYRVHQFSKVEMFIYCQPQESKALHQKLLQIEEEIFQDLEIPYRVVDICRGDLGASASRKFDIEAWLPGRGEKGDWGEMTSASNCSDYQARRLKIRYRKDDGSTELVHTLNATAIASTRTILALIENGQQQDGSICLPAALHSFCSFQKLTAAG